MKFFLFRLYPASKMIGGSNTKKKNSGDCWVVYVCTMYAYCMTMMMMMMMMMKGK